MCWVLLRGERCGAEDLTIKGKENERGEGRKAGAGERMQVSGSSSNGKQNRTTSGHKRVEEPPVFLEGLCLWLLGERDGRLPQLTVRKKQFCFFFLIPGLYPHFNCI